MSNATSLLRQVLEQLERYQERDVDLRIAERDDMIAPSSPEAMEFYLSAGRSAIDVIAQAMILAELPQVDSVLDMACGYGRVMRHLVLMFPGSELMACDLELERVQFCADTFGVSGAPSSPDPGEVDLGRQFDLIWCGSLLTHLPEKRFQSGIQMLARHLSPRGVAVASLHGRYAPIVQKHHFNYLPDKDFDAVERGFLERGFGYADYDFLSPASDRERYGISVSAPSHVTGLLEAMPEIRILGYRERAWVSHHDVVIFGKPGFAE